MWFIEKSYAYEVFISHAVEDKSSIADELYQRLVAENIRVWYSGKELITGEDISWPIYNALHDSRFGAMVFSPTFWASGWTVRELNWLEAREKREKKDIILPILHSMTHEQLVVINSSIAQKFCIHGSKGIDFVVDKIVQQVYEYRRTVKRKVRRVVAGTVLSLIVLSVLLSFVAFTIYNDKPTKGQITDAIDGRITTFLNTIDNRYSNPLKAEATLVTEPVIDSIVHTYNSTKSYYRNEYELNNGLRTVRGRKNVEDALHRNLVELADQPGYGMDSLDIFLTRIVPNETSTSEFGFVNKHPVSYETQEDKDGTLYTVKVTYTNEIRYINVLLSFPPGPTGTKRHEMTLLALLPTETYYFEKDPDGQWYFKGVE